MTVGWQVIAALSGGRRASVITKRARQRVSAPSIGLDVGQNEKRGARPRVLCDLAEWTGLEPATPGVTGRYSNQLNYHSSYLHTVLPRPLADRARRTWRPLGDSNPCNHRERVVS